MKKESRALHFHLRTQNLPDSFSESNNIFKIEKLYIHEKNQHKNVVLETSYY
jgi:hypothetical protein